MPGYLFTLRLRDVSKNCNSYVCCCQSDGMLEAISNTTVSVVQQKLREHSISIGDLEKVGNRIVAT